MEDVEMEVKKALEELAKRDDFICVSHFGYNEKGQFISWTEIKTIEKKEINHE